jgi:hypothetical protein
MVLDLANVRFVYFIFGGILKNTLVSQVPMAHTCNPSYLGGRDQEDHGSESVQANSS